MKKTGVYFGKFAPPHRGHLNSIINASTQVEKLYVVVSHNQKEMRRLCEENNIDFMDLKTRAKWLSMEFQNLDHIEVLMMREDGIPDYPNGWNEWLNLLKETVPDKIDVVFGGEKEYKKKFKEMEPSIEFKIYDPGRTKYPISATEIRRNPFKHWDYILGAARPHFSKKILITGSESCGKTSLVKKLAKIYNTSWVEEVGRHYNKKYLGGNEDYFKLEDFGRIAYLHRMEEDKAFKSANKVVFVDTDAVVTQFYCNMFLHKHSEMVETFVDRNRYDYILALTPDVKWVDDGQRFNSNQERRERLHNHLVHSMYKQRGFYIDKILEGGYQEKLEAAINFVENILEGDE